MLELRGGVCVRRGSGVANFHGRSGKYYCCAVAHTSYSSSCLFDSWGVATAAHGVGCSEAENTARDCRRGVVRVDFFAISRVCRCTARVSWVGKTGVSSLCCTFLPCLVLMRNRTGMEPNIYHAYVVDRLDYRILLGRMGSGVYERVFFLWAT